MQELKSGSLTNKYTRVFHEDEADMPNHPDIASRPETISKLLDNNESQIGVIIGRASAIREKVAGSDYSQCTKSNAPTEAYPGIPGIYRQILENTKLLADLYEIVLDIDSKL